MGIIQWESAAELRRQGRQGRRQERIETPWGVSQSVETLATGMLDVTTASHGGFLIDKERRDEMPTMIQVGDEAQGGGMWFEEDQEWVFPFLFFYREIATHPKTPGRLVYARKAARIMRSIADDDALRERMHLDEAWRASRHALADWIEQTLTRIGA